MFGSRVASVQRQLLSSSKPSFRSKPRSEIRAITSTPPLTKQNLSITPTTTLSTIVSSFQNPIVEQLWTQRGEAKDLHALTKGTQNEYSEITTPRPASFSETSITYPFSTNAFLRESYKSPWGNVRFGKILEDLDACAGNIAFKHCVCQGRWEEPMIVTAGIDRIHTNQHVLPQADTDMTLHGSITWVGSSSMEITMSVSETGQSGVPDDVWLEAKFTFVARDKVSNKAINIVPLKVTAPHEIVAFNKGELAALKKKALRKSQSTESSYTLEIDKMAADLMEESNVLLRFPSLAPSHHMLMPQTELRNALIAQPQQRNMHNRIFGGFLMRRAFELAFSTAYVFGGSKPKFIEVDDISFLAPVDVGELLLFHARVLYTLPDGGYLKLDGKHPLLMIEVEAFVTKPETVQSKLSNKFHFTFSIPGKETCKKVVPSNVLEGKRMAARIVADREQAGLE